MHGEKRARRSGNRALPPGSKSAAPEGRGLAKVGGAKARKEGRGLRKPGSRDQFRATRSLQRANLVRSMYLPTCRREKRAVPGCSTLEPQRWHSTAFRFRPSADTSSFCCSAGSIAAPPQHGPQRRTRDLGSFTRNYAGAAPSGRGARCPLLYLCAGVCTLLRRRLYCRLEVSA